MRCIGVCRSRMRARSEDATSATQIRVRYVNIPRAIPARNNKPGRRYYNTLPFLFFFALFPIWSRCIKFSFSKFSDLVILFSVLLSPLFFFMYLHLSFCLSNNQYLLTSIFHFSFLHPVFCPGFQKGRVPSEKGTCIECGARTVKRALVISAVNWRKRA